MRKNPFVAGEFYHIYAHSVGDLKLFKNDSDYRRFIVTCFSSNGKKDIPRLDRGSDLNRVWDIRDGKVDPGEKFVDLAGFCLMPTHFHLLVAERKDGNISVFMHRLLVSYAKYFNLKYNRRGHVFEGKFNAKHVNDNNYLLRISCYVHLNPKDMRGWRKKEHKYKWSSFQDYIGENRWGSLLQTEPVMTQFENKREYQEFVESARNEDLDDLLFNDLNRV